VATVNGRLKVTISAGMQVQKPNQCIPNRVVLKGVDGRMEDYDFGAATHVQAVPRRCIPGAERFLQQQPVELMHRDSRVHCLGWLYARQRTSAVSFSCVAGWGEA